jgi:hypothetical protein
MITSRLGLPVIVLLAAGYMSIYRHMTMDDTFIFAQFAVRMLNLHELAFNAHEPTYGFTSVLWLGVLYLLGLLGLDIPQSAKVLSFALALVSIAAFHALARHLLVAPAYYLAATAAWALNPVFVNIAFSGMETTLGVTLLLLGLLFHFREVGRSRGGSYAPVIFALAYLTRPEFLLLLPLWIVDSLLRSPRELRIRRLAVGLFWYALLLGVWFAIALNQFGTVIPNPVIIKSVQSRLDYDPLYALSRFALMFGSIHLADIMVMLGSGVLLVTLRRGAGSGISRASVTSILLAVYVLAVLGAYVLQRVSVSPRYFLIASPVLTLLTFHLIAIVGPIGRASRTRMVAIALAVFAVHSAAMTYLVYYPHTESYRQKDELLHQFADWMRVNTPPESAVASVDIGILGYYSDRRVIDLTGLINPDIVHRKSTIDYLRAKGVDYLLDRHPEPDQLAKTKPNSQWVEYHPVLFLSTPSRGWTAGLREDSQIGFTLYNLAWKHGN